MAQFFEMRYSKKFRINAGLLCWISGVLNFGIFPGVAARFFVYYCGLPLHYHIPGLHFAFSTYITVMLADLALALSFVLMGGQISVMITECVQGMFCTVAFVVISASVLQHFTYPQMMHALQLGSKPDASTINPFHTSKITDFNVWYYLIGVFGTFYTQLSWQGTAGFNSSARTPHEQKMGQIIANWRIVPQSMMISLLGLAALVVLRLPHYAAQAETINHSLSLIPNATVRGEMILPVAMAHVLPIGIKGLFGTVMLFISFTCHDTYMHSWGSIFVQDVYMPIKDKVLSPLEHINLLRWSILFVAAFAFLFSIWYQPDKKILFFFAATGTIWLGGSGSVIIGGLYSQRGTTAGAYAALYSGAILGLLSVFLERIWAVCYAHHWIRHIVHVEVCPINSQILWFIAMIISMIIYGVVSYVTGKGKPEFNLQKMLHRGEYADADSHIVDEFNGNRFMKFVGITSDFSKGDRFLAIVLVVWNALNFLWFVIFTVLNLFFPITDRAWILNNWVAMIISLCLSVPCTIWFLVGGTMDIRALYRHLDSSVRNEKDDGRVYADEDVVVGSKQKDAVEAGKE